jgi:hypothetical protein
MAAAYWPARAQAVRDSRSTVKPVATEVRPIQPELTRRFAAMHGRLQPSARMWVEQQARVEAQKPAPDLAALKSAIRNRFAGNANATAVPPGADIEALAFVVMMQATNDMDKDLQQIMAEVKSMTNAKQKLRDLINNVNKDVAGNAGKLDAPCLTPLCRSLASELNELATTTAGLPRPVRLSAPSHPTYANLRVLQGELKQNLDSISEMSETESLRLQMTMDRRSKFIATLSNMMKKMNETSESVVQNMK